MNKSRFAGMLLFLMGMLVGFQNCGSSLGGLKVLTIHQSTTGTNPGVKPETTETNPGVQPEQVTVPEDPNGRPATQPNFGIVLRKALCSYLYYKGVTNYYNLCFEKTHDSHNIAEYIFETANSSNYTFDYVEAQEANIETTYQYANAVICYNHLLVYQNDPVHYPPAPRPTAEPSNDDLFTAGLVALAMKPECAKFIVDIAVFQSP